MVFFKNKTPLFGMILHVYIYIYLCDCDCDFYHINCFFVILTNNARNTKQLTNIRQYIVLHFSRNFEKKWILKQFQLLFSYRPLKI